MIGIYHPVRVFLQRPFEGRHIPSNPIPTSLPFAFTFPFSFSFGSASVRKKHKQIQQFGNSSARANTYVRHIYISDDYDYITTVVTI